MDRSSAEGRARSNRVRRAIPDLPSLGPVDLTGKIRPVITTLEADVAALKADTTDADAAAAALASAALKVAKLDVQPMGPVQVDLIDSATGSTYTWRPGFAGSLVSASIVLDGATTAVGAASVAITIAGGAVTLAAPLSAPAVSASGFAVSTTVSSGGAFTANQAIRITTTSANTSATFGGVMLGYTRT